MIDLFDRLFVPAESFRDAGKHKGFDDDRQLWPQWYRLSARCGRQKALESKLRCSGSLAIVGVRSVIGGKSYAVGAILTDSRAGAPEARDRLLVFCPAYIRPLSGIKVIGRQKNRSGNRKNELLLGGLLSELGRTRSPTLLIECSA